MFRVEITDSFGNVVSNITDVSKDKTVQHTVTYDEGMGVYKITMPTVFTFVGDTYQYLFDRLIDSYCGKLTAKVYKQGHDFEYTIFDGFLFITDCDFDVKKCSVDISFVNNSWETKISSNWEVSVNMKAEQTKSSTIGAQIALVPPTLIELCDLTFWYGSEASPLTNSSAKGWDLVDVFTHVVSYISDNEVTFESAWYDGLPVDQKIILTNGVLYRTGAGDYPFFTLRDMFDHIKKLMNVIIVFEVSGSDIVMRVENESYLTSFGYTLDITDVTSLTVRIDQNKLYNSVKLGSSSSMQTNSEILPTYHFPIINGNSFANEVFTIQKECVTQNQLDLSIEWVIDHNILSKARSDEGFDGDIFIIQYNSDTNCAVESDPLGFSNLYNSEYYYNQMFINSAILSRHVIYGDLVIHVQDSDDVFMSAGSITNQSTQTAYSYNNPVNINGVRKEQTTKCQFKNDYDETILPNGNIIQPFDTNNNFGNGTTQGNTVTQANSVFVCPQTGFYRFEALTNFFVFNKAFRRFTYEQTFVRRNSGGTELDRTGSRYSGTIYSNAGSVVVNGDVLLSAQIAGVNAVFWAVDGEASEIDVNASFANEYTTGFSWYGKTSKVIFLEASDTVELEIYLAEYARIDGTPMGIPTHIYERPDDIYFTDYEGQTGGSIFLFKPLYFACTDTVNGGSSITTSQSQNVNIYDISFDSWLTNAEINSIISSSSVNANINTPEITARGIVKNLTIDHKDNLCKFVVASQKIDAK